MFTINKLWFMEWNAIIFWHDAFNISKVGSTHVWKALRNEYKKLIEELGEGEEN